MSDMLSCWEEFILISFVAVSYSAIVIILMRFIAGKIIWTILTTTVLAGICMSMFLVFKSLSVKETYLKVPYGVGATFVSFLTIFVIIFLISMRKKIKLVIELFKEAGKAVADMPSMLIQPVLVNLYQKKQIKSSIFIFSDFHCNFCHNRAFLLFHYRY
jgi:solute carrier family 44 (choline transporter-like protein), member 1